MMHPNAIHGSSTATLMAYSHSAASCGQRFAYHYSLGHTKIPSDHPVLISVLFEHLWVTIRASGTIFPYIIKNKQRYMREPSIYYIQNIHWKELEKEITQNGEQSLAEEVTIVPVRDPEFRHYLVISLSPAADQVLDALQGTKLENAGLRDRLAGIPKEPVYGKGELVDLLK